MDLFNVFINETMEQLGAPKQKWAYSERDAWKDTGASELVLMKDAAFELGGSGKSAVNFTCVTDDKSLVSGDEILLYGPDLKDIKGDSTFARIAFLGVKEISKDEQEAFNTIQNMEFVKYHVFPEGYMMRVSPESNREQVRVSKKALKKGISFKKADLHHRSLRGLQGSGRARQEVRRGHQDHEQDPRGSARGPRLRVLQLQARLRRGGRPERAPLRQGRHEEDGEEIISSETKTTPEASYWMLPGILFRLTLCYSYHRGDLNG